MTGEVLEVESSEEREPLVVCSLRSKPGVQLELCICIVEVKIWRGKSQHVLFRFTYVCQGLLSLHPSFRRVLTCTKWFDIFAHIGSISACASMRLLTFNTSIFRQSPENVSVKRSAHILLMRNSSAQKWKQLHLWSIAVAFKATDLNCMYALLAKHVTLCKYKRQVTNAICFCGKLRKQFGLSLLFLLFAGQVYPCLRMHMRLFVRTFVYANMDTSLFSALQLLHAPIFAKKTTLMFSPWHTSPTLFPAPCKRVSQPSQIAEKKKGSDNMQNMEPFSLNLII